VVVVAQRVPVHTTFLIAVLSIVFCGDYEIANELRIARKDALVLLNRVAEGARGDGRRQVESFIHARA